MVAGAHWCYALREVLAGVVPEDGAGPAGDLSPRRSA